LSGARISATSYRFGAATLRHTWAVQDSQMIKGFVDSQPIPQDDELSSLLEQAQPLRSRDARLELYRAADRRLLAECVWAGRASRSYTVKRVRCAGGRLL
jgi:hypothetical protein